MAGDNSADSAAAAVCPVDHKTRDLWLAQARAQQGQGQETALPPQHPSLPAAAATATATATTTTATAHPPPQQQQYHPVPQSSWLSFLFASPPPPPPPPSSPATTASTARSPAPPATRPFSLGLDRVVSSIPRTLPNTSAVDPSTSAASTNSASSSTPTTPSTPSTPSTPYPVNHEVETGADPASGNWVYPSEKMFFDAMRRKGHDNARAADMRVVVPIHNAVNERAWKEILQWEAPYTGPDRACACGPRLHSFAGLGGSDTSTSHMTPRARFYTLLGYTAPFDRHDWIIDRCGTRIEYVIDFYAGRPAAASAASGAPAGAPPLSFYLDVRPKLNSWEGVRMRFLRATGLAGWV